MAGKPFELSIVSDVRQVLRSNADVERSFEDVADALDDVAADSRDAGRELERNLADAGDDAARELDRATDKMGDSLESTGDAARDAGRDIERRMDDAARDGEDSAEKLERSFRDAFDELKHQGRTSTRQAADDTRRNMRDAEGATEAFRDEARSNLSESVSSFRGEIEDVPDLVQDVLGGVVADLGPAGAIGAAFAAVGLGLAVKFYEDWKEQSENVEQRISDMYDDMLESGKKYLSDQAINTEISAILHSADEAAISFARAQQIAAETGLDLTTVIRGYAGEAESARIVSDTLNEAISKADAEFRSAAEGGNAFGQAIASDSPRLNEYRDELTTVTDQIATASERAEVYRGAQVQSTEAVRAHVQALAEQSETWQDANDAIAENNENISDSTERTTANRGVLAGLIDDLLDLQDSAYEAGAGTRELTELQRQQARQFIDTAAAAGIEEDAALDLAVQLGLVPSEVATQIREQGADDVVRKADEARQAVEGIPDRTVDVGVNLRTDDLQVQYDRALARIRPGSAAAYVRFGQRVD